MMANEKELLEIFKRIEQNVATDDDIRIYNAWCNSFQQKNEQAIHAEFEEKKAELLDKINRKIERRTLKTYQLMSVAAAILILFLLTPSLYNYFTHSRDNIKPVSSLQVANDIAPGSNMATLLLSDGQRFSLSSQYKGLVTTQNSVTITQLSDSVVVFKDLVSSKERTTPGVQYNSLITDKAQKYQLVLPDGTRVWLNAATTIKFPVTFSGLSHRKVELDGEAYFEVAKDPSKPFIVITKEQEIKVLGTHFNVKSYAGKKGTVTTLLEGSVKVNNKLTLKPGEQAKSTTDGRVHISKANTATEVAWQKGYFEFNDEDVYDVMNELARWYNIEVVYEGDMPLEKMKGTISRSQNISGVLSILEATGIFKFNVMGNKVYVHKAL
jgi:hypothetical protein